MSVILILIPVSIVVAAAFLAGFIWAVRSGQYEDTCTPSLRVLLDDAGKPAGPRGLTASPADARSRERMARGGDSLGQLPKPVIQGTSYPRPDTTASPTHYGGKLIRED